MKFEDIAHKLYERDKSFEKFKHYYIKLKKLIESRQIKIKKGNLDPIVEANDVERIVRVNYILKFYFIESKEI